MFALSKVNATMVYVNLFYLYTFCLFVLFILGSYPAVSICSLFCVMICIIFDTTIEVLFQLVGFTIQSLVHWCKIHAKFFIPNYLPNDFILTLSDSQKVVFISGWTVRYGPAVVALFVVSKYFVTIVLPTHIIYLCSCGRQDNNLSHLFPPLMQMIMHYIYWCWLSICKGSFSIWVQGFEFVSRASFLAILHPCHGKKLLFSYARRFYLMFSIAV